MNNIRYYILIFFISFCFKCLQAQAQNIKRNDLLILKSLNKAERYAEALSFIKDSIDRNKANDELIIETGKTYFNLENYKEATNIYLNVNKSKSNKALLELAECFACMNKPDLSVEYLTKYLSRSDKEEMSTIKSKKAFNKISNTKAWLNLWSKDWYGKSELEIGNASYEYRIGNYEESITLLENLISNHPNNDKAFQLLALNYEKLNDYKLAYKQILIAEKLSKNNAVYQFDCSRIAFKLEKFNQAKMYINQAIKLDSSEIDYFLYRAKISIKLKKNEDAERDIQLVLRLIKNAETLQIAGNIYYETQEYLMALKYLNQAIQLESYNPSIILDRAKTYYACGSYEFAEKDYSMVLDFYPTNGEIYYLRALSRIKQKKYSTACSDLNKAEMYGYLNAETYLKSYCQQYFK